MILNSIEYLYLRIMNKFFQLEIILLWIIKTKEKNQQIMMK